MRDGRFVAREPTRDAHAPPDGQPDGGPRAERPVSRQGSRARRRAPLLRVRGLTRAGLGARRRLRGARRARSSASPAWWAPAAPRCSRACWACARARVRRAGDRRPRRCASATRARRRAHGLTYLSEDRKGKGLHVRFGLAENLTLMALRRYATPWLHPAAERAALKTAVDEFGIRTGSLDIPASSLSGGNQQKLALAKVLHPEPRVVVLDEPTRGVDVGAKRDIYFLIQRLARERQGRDRHLVRADRADRHLPPHRRDARRHAAGHAGRGPTHRGGLDCPCHRNPLKPPPRPRRSAAHARAPRVGAPARARARRSGWSLLCIARLRAEPRLRHDRQRDERAHAHRLHRHHRGGHVLRDHQRRHRPVGGLDGGADRRRRHPADERARRAPRRAAGSRWCWAPASRWCWARCSGWRTAC